MLRVADESTVRIQKNMSSPAAWRHPNDPEDVRRRLERDAVLMTEAERDEVRAMIDAALARLAPPTGEPAAATT
jgi:hypothetical protein